MSETQQHLLRRLAREAGLTRLNDQHLEQFALGLTSTRTLAERLPRDLHWTDELAVVFRLRPRQGGQP